MIGLLFDFGFVVVVVVVVVVTVIEGMFNMYRQVTSVGVLSLLYKTQPTSNICFE